MQEKDPKTGKPVVSSAGKFMGMNTIFRSAGDPYMTRIWFWRLRLHIFHRPDLDPDPHDHPWDFWTFPIWPPHGYVEEVTTEDVQGDGDCYCGLGGSWGHASGCPEAGQHHYEKRLQVVPPFRLSFRPATHCHRVLGAWTGAYALTLSRLRHFPEHFRPTNEIVDANRKLVTIVWFSKPKRAWGFLKTREGKWCWQDWRTYVLEGGKDAPCE